MMLDIAVGFAGGNSDFLVEEWQRDPAVSGIGDFTGFINSHGAGSFGAKAFLNVRVL